MQSNLGAMLNIRLLSLILHWRAIHFAAREGLSRLTRSCRLLLIDIRKNPVREEVLISSITEARAATDGNFEMISLDFSQSKTRPANVQMSSVG